MTPIEMMIEPQNEHQYRVRYDAWQYREPRDDGSDKIFLGNIPLAWLDIVSFMIARKLVDEGGYALDRELVVKLQGSDREFGACASRHPGRYAVAEYHAGDQYEI